MLNNNLDKKVLLCGLTTKEFVHYRLRIKNIIIAVNHRVFYSLTKFRKIYGVICLILIGNEFQRLVPV